MRIERDQLRTVLIVAGMVVVFGVGIWMPSRKKGTKIEQEILATQKQLEADRQTSRDMVGLRKEVIELQQIVNRAPKFVPREGELAGLLKQLSSDLELHGVADQEIQVRPIIKHAEYSIIPVSLSFKGSFGVTYGFLEKIESMERLIRIDRCNIEGKPGDTHGPVSVTIELGAFFSSDEVK